MSKIGTSFFLFLGCIFRLFIFLFFRIQSVMLLIIFTMPPNINNTGHIIIPVHMHMGELITLASLSLRSFFSYSFARFINLYLLLYLFTFSIFYTSLASILSKIRIYTLIVTVLMYYLIYITYESFNYRRCRSRLG